MDAKDLRIESALGARGDDGITKYARSGSAPQTNGNKPYHDIVSNSLSKVEVPTARPCAIIGPDRVVPPQSTNAAFVKKASVEPWPCIDNVYQHPLEYPHKPTEYQPSRNISPRQTFQENMQRIMVPPTYASVKNGEENSLKNSKLIPLESKFSDVPYTVSPINNEIKSVKGSDGVLSNTSSNQPVLSHGWTGGGGVNVRPSRPCGAHELYQYSEYPNYPGPRPISMIRPHRNVHEDVPPLYQDRFYHEANVRFKPYPTVKERPLHHPQARYEYIPNYPGVFHPHAPYPPHKYDLQKSIPTHPYSMYPPVPFKYLDRRMPAPVMEKFSRSPTQHFNLNPSFCNQNIPSNYGSVPGNCMQNRSYSYAPDSSTKHMIQNKIYYDANNAHKYYTSPENILMNDINRPPTLKNDILYPSYPPPINIHTAPTHHIYRKESSMKGYEQAIHYRNIEYSANANQLGRVPLQFLSQSMPMSSECNTSNDTSHLVGNAQEEFGYVSQSSTANIRRGESRVGRLSSDIYQRNDVRHETTSHINKSIQKVDNSGTSKEKKDLNVRQFLQMWNEGDDEGNENKLTTKQKDPNPNALGQYDSTNSQGQLYVLDLVNVPNEELAKYDHIQKISKLPENIKGYNSIELLNQYEKLVESQGLNQFSVSPSPAKKKDLHIPIRGMLRHGKDVVNASSRPLSPLDVEAKISQSVIHKEVGCNFEIRPCSPQMMNVEIATSAHNVLGERLIEKVVNSVKSKSPLHHRMEESNNNSATNKPPVMSCKMANNQYTLPNVNDSLKPNYCLQDLEGNSGVCLASLPRLDNDIELNFPEINQQFINANKISSVQDLPILDAEISTTVQKTQLQNQPFISENLPLGSELDKEVSKLSKYRKHKRSSIPSENNDTANISLHRTDSVIIKNPENINSHEENIYNVPVVNNTTCNNEITVKSVNIAVERDKSDNYSDGNVTEALYENINNYTSIDNSDIAIDFSINKSDDEQNNVISSLNHLSDSSENEMGKNMYTINSNCNTNIPMKLEEVANDINISVLGPKSPVLQNFNSSSVLNDGDFKVSNKTVITSCAPNELASDITSNASSTENIIPQNHLESMTHDSENLSKNINTPENDSLVTTDIENPVQKYGIVENSESDDNTSLCELKYNLMGVISKDHISITGVNDVCNLNLQKKEDFGHNEDDVDKSLNTDTNKLNRDDLEVQPSGKEKKCTMLTGSEVISNATTLTRKYDEGMLKFNTECDEIPAVVELNNVVYTNECADVIHTNNEECNVIKLDHNIPDNNDLTCVSRNDFSLPQCTPLNELKKDESYSEVNGRTALDSKDMKETLSLIKKDLSAKEIQDNKKLFQINYNFILKKELFSSRFQHLWMHHEGLYGPSKNKKNRVHTEQENENFKISLISTTVEKMVETEHQNNPESVVIGENKVEILVEEERANPAMLTDGSPILDANIIVLNDENRSKNGVNVTIPTEPKDENHMSECVVDVTKYNTNEDASILTDKINDVMTLENNIKDNETEVEQIVFKQSPNRGNRTLKRSLSESAVNEYTTSPAEIKRNLDNNFIHRRKRSKVADTEILLESDVISENFSSFIQGNRRNSISTIYNDEHVSFCIVIDNDCVLTEDNESCQKICYTDLTEECLTSICAEEDSINAELNHISYEENAPISNEEGVVNSDLTDYFPYENDGSISAGTNILTPELDSENIPYDETGQCEHDNSVISQDLEDKTFADNWVEDVACMETVFSDDIAEDIVISATSSPKDTESSDEESDITSYIYNVSKNEHTNKVKHIYGNQLCDNDALLVEKLYRTPQMDVNNTLISKEAHLLQGYNRYYDNESLEKILSECSTVDTCNLDENEILSEKPIVLSHIDMCDDIHGNKENYEDHLPALGSRDDTYNISDLSIQGKVSEEKETKNCDDSHLHSCEPSYDNPETYKKKEKLQYAISSSPEVSSTTSEEKCPGILLKIRSYKGSKISEVNEMSESFKDSHSQRFHNNNFSVSRPLITKAAQKYIPPLKESIRDLKVKIRLPKQSLYKLQQLKNSKEEPKIDTSHSKHYNKSLPQECPKKAKSKPKFEDVLMSIDEIQFKKHKEKNKKIKQAVPKVIIKKNENGAHYASTQPKETFNPDLTGRKWQPWVFLEKSNFVDKMALKKKFKAIYNHRKKTFVLAESFRKYKSISNAKFVISHPKCNDNISSGKLKYTFRLKHT